MNQSIGPSSFRALIIQDSLEFQPTRCAYGLGGKNRRWVVETSAKAFRQLGGDLLNSFRWAQYDGASAEPTAGHSRSDHGAVITHLLEREC